jgi:hypothetical protein
MDEYQRGTAAVTRHQIWKARERARFRAIAEWARINKLRGKATTADTHRAMEALDYYDAVCFSVEGFGIKRPFLG